MQTLDFSDSARFFKELETFCGQAVLSGDAPGAVAEILSDVRTRGDRAVVEQTERFDGAKLKPRDMRVAPEALKEAEASLTPGDRKSIREAIASVKEFHRRTLPKNWEEKNRHGGVVGERYYPIRRVGLYIPGGNVPLVSTVVMTVVLAKLVRCPEIAVATPPQRDGSIAPGMLAALSLVGADEVYKVGGVQAVGAMAYGTETIAPVDKIFGPGNAYVMEAKRQVLGRVGIDLLPGPSEIMVVADAGADPEHVAADLLAQAEHGSGKELVYLVTTGKAFAEKVGRALERRLPECRHREECAAVLARRMLVVTCRSLAQAARVANFVAPEHLELQVARGSIGELTRRITTAGAILQGYSTPTVLGDFVAGPSHTLPTGRAGRFFSGLRATDFMRRSSIVRYDAKSLEKAAPAVETFARLERLEAHGRSLTVRLGEKNQ